jgi:hypothetical protein
MDVEMKRLAIATAVFSASILASWVVFQLFATSFAKTQNTADQPLSIHRADNEAYVPVTGVEARTVAPAPVYDASGRIVSLSPNGSNKRTAILAPAANVKIAPVYDASGTLLSDPAGAVSNNAHNVKISPLFDATGNVISDPTGTLSSGRNP